MILYYHIIYLSKYNLFIELQKHKILTNRYNMEDTVGDLIYKRDTLSCAKISTFFLVLCLK